MIIAFFLKLIKVGYCRIENLFPEGELVGCDSRTLQNPQSTRVDTTRHDTTLIRVWNPFQIHLGKNRFGCQIKKIGLKYVDNN